VEIGDCPKASKQQKSPSRPLLAAGSPMNTLTR
jgi:hypothetical protein